jgi:hypothetical protein
LDFTVLNRGEKIAGVAGILLILIMFIFDWYSVKVTGISVPNSGANAWDAYSFIDIVLFITALAAIALTLLAASDAEVGIPVAASAIVTLLGILSVILIIFRIIDKPGDTGAASALVGGSVTVSLEAGVFLGLIAAAGIAVGGYLAMQEEGTSFGGEVDRFRGGPGGTGGTGGPGAGPPPPPPPPSSPPPPSQPPPASGP